jgi:hypothetical protein
MSTPVTPRLCKSREAFLLEKKTRQDRAKAPSDASEVLLIQRVEQEAASHTALSRLMSEQQLVSQTSYHVIQSKLIIQIRNCQANYV